jgi:hypothetical protein
VTYYTAFRENVSVPFGITRQTGLRGAARFMLIIFSSTM